MTWEEFAERLGVRTDRVTAWREGTIPSCGEVWHIMRLAYSVPGGIEAMLPEGAGGAEQRPEPHLFDSGRIQIDRP